MKFFKQYQTNFARATLHLFSQPICFLCGNYYANLISCCIQYIQLTPDNSNLQGKSKKVRVIGSSKKIAESKVKNSFYCTVNILITFNCTNGNSGEIDFGSSKREVRVSEGSSYREWTVSTGDKL